LLAKTYKGHKKKQNGRHNAPQGTFGVITHQVEIAGIIQGQPDKHDKPGQRHYSNESGQCRQLTPYLGAKNDNTYADHYLDYKSHIDCSHVTASEALKIRHRQQAISKIFNFVSYAGFLI
jgi:hypothetical protein